MNFTIKTSALHSTTTSCLVLGVFQNKALPETTAQVDKILKKQLSKILNAGDITGAKGQHLILHNPVGIRAKRLLLIGLGKKSDLNRKRYASVLGITAQILNKYSLTDALVTLSCLPVVDTPTDKLGQILAQTFENSVYRYNHTKSKKGKKPTLKKVDLYLSDKSQRAGVKKGLNIGSAIAKGMAVARELGNLPANFCTPSYFGDQAQALAKRNKALKTRVLGEAQMRRLGMGSLLSVGYGSDEESKLVVMEY